MGPFRSRGDIDGDNGDSERQRPTFSLARLGQRHRPRPSSPQHHKQPTPKQNRFIESDVCETPSPVFIRKHGIPIPSSFVDPFYLSNDRCAKSNLSCSSSDDDDANESERQLEKLAAKEAIRHKLKLCKAALLTGDTREIAAVQDVSCSLRSQSDTKIKSRSFGNSASAESDVSHLEKSSRIKQNSPSPVGRAKTKDWPERDIATAPSKRQRMNGSTSSSSIDTENAMSGSCGNSVARTATLSNSTDDSTSSNSQPSPEALHLIVDEVFASAVGKLGGLQACTLRQLMVVVQAKITVPFSKQTKKDVRSRITFLVNGHGRLPRQSQVRPSTEHLQATSSNSNLSKSPIREKRDAPEPPSSEQTVDFEYPVADLVETNDDSLAESSLPGARPVEAMPTTLKRRRGANPTVYKQTNTNTTLPSEQVEKPFRDSAVNGKRLQRPVSDEIVAQPTEALPAKTKRRRAVAEKPKAQTRSQPLSYATCNLCSKCPCHHKQRDSTGSTSLDLAQTDSSIEKALMNRLLKLEVLSDQYDEQTDAVRRRLKKHRREMWKKREDLIQACKDLEASRKGNAANTRFLPDVDEAQGWDADHTRLRQRQSKASVARAQGSIFDPKPTAQVTLTQMMGSRNENTSDGTVSDKDVGVQLPDDPSSPPKDNAESTLQAFAEVEKDEDERCTIEVACLDDSPSRTQTATNGRSLWGALRSGNFDSSFDALFVESLENDGVEHLLGLLGEEQPSEHQADHYPAPLSQSSLSTQGRSLTTVLTERISSDHDKLATLSVACPNWRENIVYAMRQRDKADVDAALQQVRDEREALQRMKEMILSRIEHKEAVLDVFEETLELSLSRFDPPLPPTIEDGFFPSQTLTRSPNGNPTFHGLTNHRQSVESEVRTILASAMSPNDCGHSNSGRLSLPSTPLSNHGRSRCTDSIPTESVLCCEGSVLPETPLSSDSKHASGL